MRYTNEAGADPVTGAADWERERAAILAPGARVPSAVDQAAHWGFTKTGVADTVSAAARVADSLAGAGCELRWGHWWDALPVAAAGLVPTVGQAVNRPLAGPAEAVSEAGVLVLAVEAPAHAVAAVGFVAHPVALTRGQAVPATLADGAGRPLLGEAITRDPAAFEAVPGAAVLVFPFVAVAGAVAAGDVVAELEARLRLAFPAALARSVPFVPVSTVSRRFARLVTIGRAALLRLAAGCIASPVTAGYAIARLLAFALFAGKSTGARLGPLSDAVGDGVTFRVANGVAYALGVALPVSFAFSAIAAPLDDVAVSIDDAKPSWVDRGGATANRADRQGDKHQRSDETPYDCLRHGNLPANAVRPPYRSA